jgi:hypothetical protein
MQLRKANGAPALAVAHCRRTLLSIIVRHAQGLSSRGKHSQVNKQSPQRNRTNVRTPNMIFPSPYILS